VKKTVRVIIIVALAVIFAGSLGMFIFQKYQDMEAEKALKEALELAQNSTESVQNNTPSQQEDPAEEQEEPTEAVPPVAEVVPPATESTGEAQQETPPAEKEPEKKQPDVPQTIDLEKLDLSALRSINEDVMGWIQIPGTRISYPLMDGDDNSYYLNHNWKKQRNSAGAVFLEQWNDPDFSDFNTIIYAHRMNNGSMFTSLKNYSSQSYWNSNPRVYIAADSGVRCYEIFAAYEAAVDSNTYQLSFADAEARQAFLDSAMERSKISTGIVPTVEDSILTLSTCTGKGPQLRWVVQCRLVTE